MKVIIRDDDISFFTHPELLQQLYEPLWSRGLPVCLSVIPNHYDSVMVKYRSSVEKPDENTPPPEFGKGASRPIRENIRLVTFLSDLDTSDYAEICVHGFEHRFREFDVDAERAEKLLVVALGHFDNAFPQIKPKTFVPPYDSISPAALRLLAKHQFNVATALDTARGLKLSGSEYKEDGIFESGNKSLVFASDSYLFDPLKCDSEVERALEETLSRHPKFLIITNHYWDFFDKFTAPKRQRIQLWLDFVQALIEIGAVFTTFRREAIWVHR